MVSISTFLMKAQLHNVKKNIFNIQEKCQRELSLFL